MQGWASKDENLQSTVTRDEGFVIWQALIQILALTYHVPHVVSPLGVPIFSPMKRSDNVQVGLEILMKCIGTVTATSTQQIATVILLLLYAYQYHLICGLHSKVRKSVPM